MKGQRGGGGASGGKNNDPAGSNRLLRLFACLGNEKRGKRLQLKRQFLLAGDSSTERSGRLERVKGEWAGT